jgi:hypothetical protein
MKSPLLLSLFLVFALQIGRCESPSSLPARYDKWSCAMVRITSDDGSSGSGFFVSDGGTIVTAAHVVMSVELSMDFLHKNAAITTLTPKSNLKATTYWGVTKEIQVTDTKEDENMAGADLAVIKTNLPSTCHLEIGDSDLSRIGEHLIAFGFPTFDTLSATLQPKPQQPMPALYEGILSARHVHMPIHVGKIGDQDFTATYEVMRLQMPVTGGASGGPVINDQDKVVGIVTEETTIWSPVLADYAIAINNSKSKSENPSDLVTLSTGQQADARQILGLLAQTVREFESPGAGLAVPTKYLKLSKVEDH